MIINENDNVCSISSLFPFTLCYVQWSEADYKSLTRQMFSAGVAVIFGRSSWTVLILQVNETWQHSDSWVKVEEERFGEESVSMMVQWS